VILTFIISATENPPAIRDIGQVNVSEDVETVLELGSYVSDPDTLYHDLAIATTSGHITVEGAELHILYPVGGVLDTVTLIVSDGVSSTRRDFVVSVSSRDDPPVIGVIPLQNVIEDQEGCIDLGSYITDEDTPISSLSLTCEWPRVTSVTAFCVFVLYEISIDLDAVPFNVSDGCSTVTGRFTVHVNPVNDPPRLLGIGSASPPITLTVHAGKWTYFDLKAADEEEMTLAYSVQSPQNGLSITAGKLRIAPLSKLLPPFQARLTVSDSEGATDSVLFTVVVLDPGALSLSVHVVSPANHSTYQEGDPIPFSVIVLFPTGTPAGPVEVRWSSDLQGSVLRLTSETGLSANVSWLTPGDHLMTVSASSGSLTATAWFVVTVTGRETGGGGGTIDSANAYMLGAIVSVIVATVIASFIAMHRKVPVPGPAAPPKPVKPPPPILVTEPQPAGGPIYPSPMAQVTPPPSATAPSMTSVVSTPRPAPPMAGPAAAPAMPSPTMQAKATLSKEEQKARIAAVKAAIEAMPGGIPRELRLFDSWTIAERVVKGKTMTAPDGTPLVNVMDGWYVDTPDDPDRFLRPWSE